MTFRDRPLLDRVRGAVAAALACAALAASSAPVAAAGANASVCAMVPASDIGGLFGKAMKSKPPEMDLPQASGCDWEAADGKKGFMTVRMIPPRYLPEPSLGKAFSKLPGIGDKANVVEDMGGWNAGAIKGSKAVVIHVEGGKASRAMAIAMLKKYVQKL